MPVPGTTMPTPAHALVALLAVCYALWPLPEPVAFPQHTRVLLQAPHPLQFRLYLYEGFDRRQRAAFRSADPAMRLVVE